MAAARSMRSCLRPLLRRLRGDRGLLFAFSTAAEQRSAGDDCGPEEPRDGPRHHLDENASGSTSDSASDRRTLELEEQVRDLTERYQRALMDSETIRRRTQKIVEDAKRFGIQCFCKDLVEVVDILEKTTESTVEGVHSDPDSALKNICEGLSLIESKLQGVFSKHGLQKMKPIGGKYDPYDHEVVCHVRTAGMEPGTVALVSLDGYKLHGRTIRHARVGVAVESHE
uniref:grpE protein homolog 2, mitochondrial n=1 Tax=Euleptes europaea TaxID=460621 RepID=UPI002540EA81|nr:grpE protein homolog 2, mitochondrial [Euleptes europaea]